MSKVPTEKNEKEDKMKRLIITGKESVLKKIFEVISSMKIIYHYSIEDAD